MGEYPGRQLGAVVGKHSVIVMSAARVLVFVFVGVIVLPGLVVARGVVVVALVVVGFRVDVRIEVKGVAVGVGPRHSQY